jgi:hypothetical protein
MTEVQTRSEETGLKFHKTIREALDYAEKDKTVWKISFSSGKERVRLVKDNEDWKLEMMDKILDDAIKQQQEWLEKKGTRVKKPL